MLNDLIKKIDTGLTNQGSGSSRC